MSQSGTILALLCLAVSTTISIGLASPADLVRKIENGVSEFQSKNAVTTENKVEGFEFDYYVFTLLYPQTECIDASSSHDCEVPKNVSGWTIHGLWPNRNSGDNPFYCDNNYPFNDKEVYPLWSQLLQQWPNFYNDEAADSFWEHEWDKHGTCAYRAGQFSSEFDFFNRTLALRENFPVSKWLSDAGIFPDDDKVINGKDLLDAVSAAVGVQAVLVCGYDQKIKMHVPYELEFCLDLDLNPKDCGWSYLTPECAHDNSLVYPATTHPDYQPTDTTTPKSDLDFDYYVFTQIWPQSSCSTVYGHTCAIPSNVTGWTIHGLWPSNFHGSYPQNCDNHYHFSDKEIQPIWGDLEKYWTNLFTDEPVDSFWEHEWVKHGTCAYKAGDFDSEFDYFNSVLNLKHNYPLFQWLKDAGFSPDNGIEQNAEEMLRVVKKKLNNKQPIMVCQYDQDKGVHVPYEIEVCLDRNLEPIDCHKSDYTENCPHDNEIIYPASILSKDFSHNLF